MNDTAPPISKPARKTSWRQPATPDRGHSALECSANGKSRDRRTMRPRPSRVSVNACLLNALREGGGPESRGATGSCRSEEHTSELQSLIRLSYEVLCL